MNKGGHDTQARHFHFTRVELWLTGDSVANALVFVSSLAEGEGDQWNTHPELDTIKPELAWAQLSSACPCRLHFSASRTGHETSKKVSCYFALCFYWCIEQFLTPLTSCCGAACCRERERERKIERKRERENPYLLVYVCHRFNIFNIFVINAFQVQSPPPPTNMSGNTSYYNTTSAWHVDNILVQRRQHTGVFFCLMKILKVFDLFCHFFFFLVNIEDLFIFS